MKAAALELRRLECGSWSRPVSFQAVQGELVVLLGRNGSGKTTLLNTIAGLLRSVSGDIYIQGRRVNEMDCAERVRSGVHIALEGRQLFGRLSVRRNLALGMFKSRRHQIEEDVTKILSIFPDLGDKLDERAAFLSGGQQTMVSVARALMGDPAIVLLDEPTLGLAPQNAQRLIEALRSVCTERHITVLVAEQNGLIARAFPSHVIVLVGGEVSFEGSLTQAASEGKLSQIFP